MAKVYFAGFVPAEEGGYYISIPDVPNAFTEADTLEDGMKMATDVLSTMLRDFVKNGRPTPEPSPTPEDTAASGNGPGGTETAATSAAG